ncbi:MAG: hypothetical protein KQH63_17325 [Desulfobulbaceae bacterium]|nr:hypothetical protein [Desulfobulbaceae bacterium]
MMASSNRLLKNVASEAETWKNEAKKRSLHGVNEHFEPNFDAVSASAVVFNNLLKNIQPLPTFAELVEISWVDGQFLGFSFSDCTQD